METIVSRVIGFRFGVLVVFTAADVLWWCWADHRLRGLSRPRLWRRLLAWLMGGQIGLLLWWLTPTGLIWHMPQGLSPIVSGALFLWHLFALPTGLLVGLGHQLARGGVAFGGLIRKDAEAARIAPAVETAPEHESHPLLTRRRFLAAGAVAAAPLVLSGSVGAGLWQQGRFRVHPFSLAFAGLPPELAGLRIVHITDVHIGPFTTPPMLQDIADTANGLKPDLIVLTGDLINHEISAIDDAVAFIKRLRARHGLAMCIGNHDIIESRGAFATAIRTELPQVALLVNEQLRVPGLPLQLLGLDWVNRPHTPEQELRKLRPLIDPNPAVFKILLAHHPHAFDAAGELGIPLTLSGHTHGGQLMLTETIGAGPMIFRYISGVYPRNRTTGPALLVSNGVGNWFPLRINAPAEIGLLTLGISPRS